MQYIGTGKTSWSSVSSTWSGRRSLVESDGLDSRGHVVTAEDSMHRILYTSLPPWCSYVGVTCDTNSGSATYASVTSIILVGQSLVGTIPGSISNLAALHDLELNNNQLVGTIPSGIGSFTNLYQLVLTSNSLSGTIPSSIGSLSSLQYFYLDNNMLVGTIPGSIGSLTKLFNVDLSTNSLTGTIPSSIGTLVSLIIFAVANNKLVGTIPSTFSQLTQLSTLKLNNNYLTMGSATIVPTSTFSSATLSSYESSNNVNVNLGNNCLAFTSGTVSVYVTHCAPTSSPTLRPTASPTSAPTTRLSSVVNEGITMTDFARAIPRLTVLTGMFSMNCAISLYDDNALYYTFSFDIGCFSTLHNIEAVVGGLD